MIAWCKPQPARTPLYHVTRHCQMSPDKGGVSGNTAFIFLDSTRHTQRITKSGVIPCLHGKRPPVFWPTHARARARWPNTSTHPPRKAGNHNTRGDVLPRALWRSARPSAAESTTGHRGCVVVAAASPVAHHHDASSAGAAALGSPRRRGAPAKAAARCTLHGERRGPVLGPGGRIHLPPAAAAAAWTPRPATSLGSACRRSGGRRAGADAAWR